MNRPSSNASPARRRITPIAVNAQDQVVSAAFAAEQPLRLGPALALGNIQDISTSGPGRRVWVDIQNTIDIHFKDVLRQQGLDYVTWIRDVEQRRAKLEGAPQGRDARRKGITGRLYQRTVGLYEASDEEVASDLDESDEAAPASDGAREDGDAAGSEGDDEEDDEEEDDDDDDDDEKEGNETGGEIDLDREEEAAKGRKATKPKRQRFERYDDDFIDDSELEMVKGAAREVKTKFLGFYATKGGIEVVEEPSKPRSKLKARAPKAPAAAADAAKADGTRSAAGAGAVGKKRKQVDKQQQGADPAAPGHAAAAGNGADVGKKKRQRSEAPAAAATETVAASGAADKPPAPKKVKPTPVPAAGDAAAAASCAAVTGGNVPAAAPVAGLGTAKMAVAAALAAKQKQRIQPERLEVDGAQSAAAAAATPAAVNGRPNAASGAVDTTGPDVAASATATGGEQQRPLEQGLPAASATGAGPAAGIAGVSADAAPAAVDGDVPDAAAAAVTAGLPADLVAAVHTLQEKVIEHKPSGKGSSMSQPVKQAVKNVGLTFLLMTGELQQQNQDKLLQVLTPLMLPYGKDKKLRKELFEVPKKDLDDSRQKTDILLQQLEQMKQQQAAQGQAPDVDDDDDDFQSDSWTTDAEQALVEAWDTAKVQQQLLLQLAADVSEKLRWPQQPDRAVEDLRHIYNKAKKKPRKESKKDQQQTSQAPTPRSTTPQPPSLQQQSSFSSRDATASQPASRQSPAPKAVAATDAGGGERSATSNPTHKADRAGSAGAGTGLAADPDAGYGAAAGGGSTGTAGKKEQEKFSTCQAPSPRLQRCLEAAEAAGAPHGWLADHCPKPKQSLLNQIFRVLCVAGPQGCTVKGMVAKASEHDLGFGWEDSGTQRGAITSSLHTQGGVRMAGVTETDPAAFALQCFKGVVPQPIKPKQAKSAAEAAAGATQPTAAEEVGQQAAECNC